MDEEKFTELDKKLEKAQEIADRTGRIMYVTSNTGIRYAMFPTKEKETENDES